MKIFQKKLSVAEQARLLRRFSSLLGAGISLLEAIRLMRHPLFDRVGQGIERGEIASSTFAQLRVFDRSVIEIMRIGALYQAAASLESRDAVSRKITGALIYPSFIGCATLGIACFLIVYIFPKIIPLVVSMGIPLPIMTRVLMMVSRVLIQYWPAIILMVTCSGVMSVLLWKYSSAFSLLCRRLILSLPIIGGMIRSRIIVDIFRPLGLLLEHGELLPSALVSVSKSLSNADYKALLFTTSILINNGDSFAVSIASTSTRDGKRIMSLLKNLIPHTVIDFIKIGERTGGLASACNHIATIYEAEVEELVKRMSVLVEPALMLGMGITAGAIALSIVMPIYEITNHLTK